MHGTHTIPKNLYDKSLLRTELDRMRHALHVYCWTYSLSVFQWSHQTQSARAKKNSRLFITVLEYHKRTTIYYL